MMVTSCVPCGGHLSPIDIQFNALICAGCARPRTQLRGSSPGVEQEGSPGEWLGGSGRGPTIGRRCDRRLGIPAGRG